MLSVSPSILRNFAWPSTSTVNTSAFIEIWYVKKCLWQLHYLMQLRIHFSTNVDYFVSKLQTVSLCTWYVAVFAPYKIQWSFINFWNVVHRYCFIIGIQTFGNVLEISKIFGNANWHLNQSLSSRTSWKLPKIVQRWCICSNLSFWSSCQTPMILAQKLRINCMLSAVSMQCLEHKI